MVTRRLHEQFKVSNPGPQRSYLQMSAQRSCQYGVLWFSIPKQVISQNLPQGRVTRSSTLPLNMYKDKSIGAYCRCRCYCHSTHQLQRNVYGATAVCSNKTDPLTTAKARMDNRAVVGVSLRYEGNPLVSLCVCPQVEGRTWRTTKANIGFSSSSSAAWDEPTNGCFRKPLYNIKLLSSVFFVLGVAILEVGFVWTWVFELVFSFVILAERLNLKYV